ncbi:MAG: dynamin family protein [Paludibacteraceae bacterium]|nr:dynamin family protein [Paludibacteraceae bacterium]
MNNLNEILRCIELNAQQHLSGSVLKDIDSKIKRCRSKMNDEKIYLALVGEFSSGKSTFINALLGFRLLKEAVMPTTACATYILSKGKILTVKVTFFDGNKFEATSNDFSEIATYLASTYNRNRSTLEEVIEDITSDQKIAKTVKELEILVPNAKIPRNVVLIDTPGFNPGAESVDNHYEITKHVVEEIADAALVLTPQEQAMSATLLRFLKETLNRCLHRCYFVITKMDNSDPAHRTDIFNFAKQRIIKDLNVRNPRLYAESAITMLPVKKIPSTKVDDWAFYSLMFKQFESALWDNIKKSKDIVLNEHVNNLVREIAEQCSQMIQKQEVAIKTEREFLAQHKIEKIQNVCRTMVSQSVDAINDVLNNVSLSLWAERNSKERAERIISEGTMSMDMFKNNKLPLIRNAVENEAQKALEALNRELNKKLKQCVDQQIVKMQNVFASHYDSFPSLRPKSSTLKTDLIRFKTPNMSFSIALSKIEELKQKENEATGWGGASGAGIGFLLGGPIGALIGGAIGAFGGAVAGDQSDQMRASTKPLVNNEISSFFTSLRIKIDNEKNDIKTRYISILKQFAQEHISHYGVTVEELIKKHENQIMSLDNQIKQLRTSLTTLVAIRENIEEELALLRLRN